MPSPRFFKRVKPFLLILPVLMLSACGDGWEAVSYSGFPYGNERTAGHGIAYVRANLLPGRGPMLQAAQPENEIIIKIPGGKEPVPAPVVEEVPAQSNEASGVLNALDKAFNKEQRK